MTGGKVGPELKLLAECCRWNFASVVEGAPSIPSTLDWDRFALLARRHRVQGLAWNALAQAADDIPPDVRQELSADAKAIAAANLAITAECRELMLAFENGGVPLLFVKGLPLGALCYRAPLLKMGWDIDLLIEPGDLLKAADLLQRRGYVPRLPRSISRLQSWHARSKESEWIRDERIHVELHTRLADNPNVIPSLDVHAPRQSVEVAPNLSLPTLAGDELFAYLAVHGSSSAWFRLKWISDFAALVHGLGAGEIERLHRRSQELDAARAAGQALLVADAYFDLLDPAPALRDKLASNRATRLLADAALRELAASAEPTCRPLGTFAIHWTQFLLRPGLGYKLSELGRQAASLINRSAR